MPEYTQEVEKLLKNTYPFEEFPDALFEKFADALTILDLSAGQEIYTFGDNAGYFYIVLDGHIQLNRKDKHGKINTFAVIDQGEFFGLEATQPRKKYQARAFAKSYARILAIRSSDLIAMMRESELLETYLMTLTNSYYPLLEMRLSWKEEDEHVFWSARRHPLFLWAKLLIPISLFLTIFIGLILISLALFEYSPITTWLLIAVFIFTGLWSWYIYFNWQDDFFIVTDRKIISRQRDILIYETKNAVPFSAVQAVNKNIPGFWAARLNYGDVDIRTYTGVLKINQIADPEAVFKLIQTIRDRRSIASNQYTRRERIIEMRKRLGLFSEEALSGSNDDTPPGENDLDLQERSSLSWLNDIVQTLFRLRVVKGDEVTYRKHWLILLRSAKGLFFLFFAFLAYLGFVLVSWLTLSAFTPPWALSIPVLIIGVVVTAILIYRYIDWRNDRFVLTNRTISDLDKKPFGKENQQTAPLNNIQSIQYKREGLLGIIFNFGTVFIRVGDREFTFDEVANPAAVQEEINERLNVAKERARQQEIERERNTILDWIETYHTVVNNKDKLEDEKLEEKKNDRIEF